MHTNPIKLDEALDRSLEAAVDPSLWPQVLDRMAEATGSFGAALIPTTERSLDAILLTESLAAPFDYYFENGWHINEWRMKGLPLVFQKGTACDQEYTTRDEFNNLEYYRWHAKFGIGKSCIVGYPSSEEFVCLALHRTLGSDFFDASEAAILRRVRGRLIVSARIARAISATKVVGMIDAFQSTNTAAVFFDRFCRVTAVTSHAERYFGQENGIDLYDRMLISPIPEMTAAIQNRMKAALSSNWLKPDEPVSEIYVGPPGHPAKLSLRIQRLGGDLPDLFSHSIGICLIEAVTQVQPDSQRLRQLFGLTPAEASIAILISQGFSSRNVAENKGISYETVRTHLRSIFSKTDTKRQAELIALLTRLSTGR